MGKKTRSLTLSALFAALIVISLYIASIWPSGQLGIVAFSSIFIAAAVVEGGLGSSLYVYVVSSALCMLLTPDKTAPLLFILFFGYYPIVKCLIERLRRKVYQWILKLLVFNAALTVIWIFLRGLLFSFAGSLPGAAFIFVGGNIIFALFDYGFSKVIWLYIERISHSKY